MLAAPPVFFRRCLRSASGWKSEAPLFLMLPLPSSVATSLFVLDERLLVCRLLPLPDFAAEMFGVVPPLEVSGAVVFHRSHLSRRDHRMKDHRSEKNMALYDRLASREALEKHDE